MQDGERRQARLRHGLRMALIGRASCSALRYQTGGLSLGEVFNDGEVGDGGGDGEEKAMCSSSMREQAWENFLECGHLALLKRHFAHVHWCLLQEPSNVPYVVGAALRDGHESAVRWMVEEQEAGSHSVILHALHLVTVLLDLPKADSRKGRRAQQAGKQHAPHTRWTSPPSSDSDDTSSHGSVPQPLLNNFIFMLSSAMRRKYEWFLSWIASPEQRLSERQRLRLRVLCFAAAARCGRSVTELLQYTVCCTLGVPSHILASCAALGGNVEVFQFLRQCGAFHDLTSATEKRAVLESCGGLPITEMLLADCAFAQTHGGAAVALVAACKRGQLDVVRWLLHSHQPQSCPQSQHHEFVAWGPSVRCVRHTAATRGHAELLHFLYTDTQAQAVLPAQSKASLVLTLQHCPQAQLLSVLEMVLHHEAPRVTAPVIAQAARRRNVCPRSLRFLARQADPVQWFLAMESVQSQSQSQSQSQRSAQAWVHLEAVRRCTPRFNSGKSSD